MEDKSDSKDIKTIKKVVKKAINELEIKVTKSKKSNDNKKN